jgi:phosphoribosylaminoimidazole-succinocarboxamide synthase
LSEAIFTPSTKASKGHDINISFEQMKGMVGEPLAEEVRRVSLTIYQRAAALAEPQGILIADTKLEFGLDSEAQQLMLIDEILTPDSSRFWPKDRYVPGGSQPSFDKQFVRDYLDSINWKRQPPAPHLPEEIIQKTSQKYFEALDRLAGRHQGFSAES